jgi:hypothetical protein
MKPTNRLIVKNDAEARPKKLQSAADRAIATGSLRGETKTPRVENIYCL